MYGIVFCVQYSQWKQKACAETETALNRICRTTWSRYGNSFDKYTCQNNIQSSIVYAKTYDMGIGYGIALLCRKYNVEIK